MWISIVFLSVCFLSLLHNKFRSNPVGLWMPAWIQTIIVCLMKTCRLCKHSPLPAFLHKVSTGWHFVLKSCEISTVVAFEWVGCWMMAMHSTKQLSGIEITHQSFWRIQQRFNCGPSEKLCVCMCTRNCLWWLRVPQCHRMGVLYGPDWIYMLPNVLRLLILEIFLKFPKSIIKIWKSRHCQRRTVHRLSWITPLPRFSSVSHEIFSRLYCASFYLIIAEIKGFNRSLWLFTNAAHSDIYSLPVSTDCRSTLLVFFF